MSLRKLARFAFLATVVRYSAARVAVRDEQAVRHAGGHTILSELTVFTSLSPGGPLLVARQESTPLTTSLPETPQPTPRPTSLPETPEPSPSPTFAGPATETRGCSPKTCGKACGAANTKNETSLGKRENFGHAKRYAFGFAKRAVPRKTEPAACKWAEPGNYENPADFMASEGNLGKSQAPGTENSVIVPLPLDGRSSSKMITFGDKPVTLAIPHLVGCTSIIVISKKGAWANHIWELPTFRPDPNEDEDGNPLPGWFLPGFVGDERPVVQDFPRDAQLAFFKSNAIDRLHSRYDPETPEHESGLDPLRSSGNIFDDESDFRVFMFEPFISIYDENDPNYGKEQPNGLPPAWDRNGLPSPRGDDDATAYNDQIKDELKTIFGKQDLDINVVMYAPNLDDPEDAGFKSHRGRALVQYQPQATNEDGGKAQWRVFFEAEQQPHDQAEWDALDSQNCTP